MMLDGADREVLSAVFAARVGLVRSTPEQAAKDAVVERDRAIEWMLSPSKKQGSFLWMCAAFGVDAERVRKTLGVV